MKKILAMAFIALTALSACTGNDDENSGAGGTLLQTITHNPGTNDEEVFTLEYDGTKLKTITHDEVIEKYTYTGEWLSLIEIYRGNVLLVKHELQHNAQGQLISEMSLADAEYYYFSKSNYVYNTNGTVSKTTYDDMAGTNVVSTGTFTFANGNLVHIDSSIGDRTYTFDSKKNPFRNVKDYATLILALQEGGMNNILSVDYAVDNSQKTYTYTYNGDGFPVTQTELHNGETHVVKYAY